MAEPSRTPLAPRTGTAERALPRSAHALFEVSLFSADYFTESRIADLASWGAAHTASMHFVVLDAPAAYAFKAFGYTTRRALRRAHGEGRRLRSTIRKVRDELALPAPSCQIPDWQDVAANPRYRRLLASTRAAFDGHPDFRAACLDAATELLRQHQPELTLLRHRVNTAAQYLLSELPLAIDTPGIMGVGDSVCRSHRSVAATKVLAAVPQLLDPVPSQRFLPLPPTGPDIPAQREPRSR